MGCFCFLPAFFFRLTADPVGPDISIQIGTICIGTICIGAICIGAIGVQNGFPHAALPDAALLDRIAVAADALLTADEIIPSFSGNIEWPHHHHPCLACPNEPI